MIEVILGIFLAASAFLLACAIIVGVVVHASSD